MIDYPQSGNYPRNNTIWNKVDHSYPRNYYVARENFIRKDGIFDRQWMSLFDTKTGTGTIHG